MNKILLTNCSVMRDAVTPLQHNSYVAIDNGVIESLGPMAECPLIHEHDTIIDGGGKLLMPGLINSHNHCAMSLFRGLADDLELTSWLQDHIFPAEAAHVNPEMVYWCSKLAAAEMILSGTTTVADGYFFSTEAARALDDSGLRAVVAHGIVDFPAPSVPDPKKNVETVKEFLDQWQDRSPLVSAAVFAHAPYTCSPRTLKRAKDLADQHGVRFFIHIAESKGEQEIIIDPQGPTPIQHLAALGILDANCVCVHSVWLDDRDLDILAASGASVVTCPQSNLKLASGIARVQEMLNNSISVGLGTDGCASNNSLDMFREMDMLAKIQKASTGDATAVSAAAVLGCATSAGARVLGLSHCGKIQPRFRADVILLAVDTAHLTPLYNQNLLVYAASGSDVDTVVINGRVVMQDRHILSFDCHEALNRVRALAADLRP